MAHALSERGHAEPARCRLGHREFGGARARGGRAELRTPQEGDRRGCLLSTPRKTKSSPVFPVVGQLLQRHARHITSNGHSGRQSTRAVRIEERELEAGLMSADSTTICFRAP